MFPLPTVVGTLVHGRTVGNRLNLSSFARACGVDDARFVQVLNLSSINPPLSELRSKGWEQPVGSGNWKLPGGQNCCAIFPKDQCPMDPVRPSARAIYHAPQPQRPPQRPPVRTAEPQRTWTEWFWSWFGY